MEQLKTVTFNFLMNGSYIDQMPDAPQGVGHGVALQVPTNISVQEAAARALDAFDSLHNLGLTELDPIRRFGEAVRVRTEHMDPGEFIELGDRVGDIGERVFFVDIEH